MIIRPTRRRYFWILLLAFLAACGKQTVALSIETETPFPTAISPTSVPTSTMIPATFTPSPLPTQPIIAITPDPTHLMRWEEYEEALAMKLLPSGIIPRNPGEVLCEWALLGRSDQEVYVWALCQAPAYVTGMPPTIASIPAVVHIGIDGAVQSVEIPGSGTAYALDIREMFPPDVQEIIFRHSVDTEKMEAHINSRRENPAPPSIVLSATPMP